MLQHAKFELELDIPVKYSDAKLTKGRWHHVDHVPKCTSTNSLCNSSYETKSVAAAQNRALQQIVENDLLIILVSIFFDISQL